MFQRGTYALMRAKYYCTNQIWKWIKYCNAFQISYDLSRLNLTSPTPRLPLQCHCWLIFFKNSQQVEVVSRQEAFQNLSVLTLVSSVMSHVKWKPNAYLLNILFEVCSLRDIDRNYYFRKAFWFTLWRQVIQKETKKTQWAQHLPSPIFTFIWRKQIKLPHGDISIWYFYETCLQR